LIHRTPCWNFSKKKIPNFSKHIRRSIPFYDQGHELTCQLSDFFVKNNSVCYELGISVGELLLKLVDYHKLYKPCAFWYGVDIEKDMIEEAEKKLGHYSQVKLETADISHYSLKKSDFIVSYYSLQFISARYRQRVLHSIYTALHLGGGFVWFEKVRGNDARFQDILTALYTEYKLEQGFHAEEILEKTRSLRGVLEPFSSEENHQLLRGAGFQAILPIMKYLCFEGILAIK